MSCNFCAKAPLQHVRDLDRDVTEGKLSLLELAEVHGLTIKIVRRHVQRCLGGTPTTGYAMLQRNLRSLEKLAKAAKEEYDQISPYDDGSDNSKNQAMRRLLDVRREQRESIMALERIKPSDQLMDEIIASSIAPLIANITEVCTDEMRRLRKTLAAYVEEEDYYHLDTAVKDALLRIGERFYQEQLQIQPSLKKILHSEHASKGKPSDKSFRDSKAPSGSPPLLDDSTLH